MNLKVLLQLLNEGVRHHVHEAPVLRRSVVPHPSDGPGLVNQDERVAWLARGGLPAHDVISVRDLVLRVGLDDAGRRLELWVPLASDEPVAEVDRRLYEPQSQPSNRIQAVAGALLYAVVMGLLVVTARSTRRLVISKLT